MIVTPLSTWRPIAKSTMGVATIETSEADLMQLGYLQRPGAAPAEVRAAQLQRWRAFEHRARIHYGDRLFETGMRDMSSRWPEMYQSERRRLAERRSGTYDNEEP